jgi:hypothetical protein
MISRARARAREVLSSPRQRAYRLERDRCGSGTARRAECRTVASPREHRARHLGNLCTGDAA